VAFLCIFQNKPINKMPQCYFPVSAVFVFQKSYTGNILGIGRNKSQSSYFSWNMTESKAETEGRQEAAAPPHGAGHPLPMLGCGVGPWSLPHAALPPINSPRRENLKDPINFP
jgi:hypothetical protein